MNLAFEKGERVTTGGKAEVKMERSLEWLQMCLLRIAWEKVMEHLVDGFWKTQPS